MKNSTKLTKHLKMMGICCLIPIVIAIIAPFITTNLLGTALLSSLASLICPIMMIFMMLGLFKNHNDKDCCSHSKEKDLP